MAADRGDLMSPFSKFGDVLHAEDRNRVDRSKCDLDGAAGSILDATRHQQRQQVPEPVIMSKELLKLRQVGSKICSGAPEDKLRVSRIPQRKAALPRKQEISGSLPVRNNAAFSHHMLARATNMRAYSVDPSAIPKISTTSPGQARDHPHSRSGSFAYRSKSVAMGVSNPKDAGDSTSTSGAVSHSLWYEVGRPGPSSTNKRLNATEKHKEAFQSALAQGLNSVKAERERELTPVEGQSDE